MSDASAWVYVVPIAGASLSTSGALYVGWRNRELTRRLATFQANLAATLFRRQLCLALGSRALLVGRRAGDAARALEALESTGAAIRQAEMRRRSDHIDRACDAFLESWAEAINWDLGTPEVIEAVDRLSDQIEAARLVMLLRKPEGDTLRDALLAAQASSEACQRACGRAANAYDDAAAPR